MRSLGLNAGERNPNNAKMQPSLFAAKAASMLSCPPGYLSGVLPSMPTTFLDSSMRTAIMRNSGPFHHLAFRKNNPPTYQLNPTPTSTPQSRPQATTRQDGSFTFQAESCKLRRANITAGACRMRIDGCRETACQTEPDSLTGQGKWTYRKGLQVR